MPGIDLRSSAGRRFKDLIREFSAQVSVDGAPLSQADTTLVRQAAIIVMRIEALQADFVNGNAPVDDEDLVRLSNTLARVLGQLTREPDKIRPGRPPSKSNAASIEEHFASRRNAAGKAKPKP